MRCGTARALLPLYLDGVLSLGEHEEVADHLNQCQSCAKLKALHETPLPPLPSLPDGVMRQFMQELEESLDNELSLRHLERVKQAQRSPAARSMHLPWPVAWLSGALVGATATWVVVGVAPAPGWWVWSAGRPPEHTSMVLAAAPLEDPRLDGLAGDDLITEEELLLSTYELLPVAASADHLQSGPARTPTRQSYSLSDPVFFNLMPTTNEQDGTGKPIPIPVR